MSIEREQTIKMLEEGFRDPTTLSVLADRLAELGDSATILAVLERAIKLDDSMIEQLPRDSPRRDWFDLGYSALAKVDDWGDIVQFDVFELSGDLAQPVWNADVDPTTSFEESRRFLHGFIKWDHCSEWIFDQNVDACTVHFCGLIYLTRLNDLFTRLYAWAAELMPGHWDHE